MNTQNDPGEKIGIVRIDPGKKFRIVQILRIKVGNYHPYSENTVRFRDYSALGLPLLVQFLNFIRKKFPNFIQKKIQNYIWEKFPNYIWKKSPKNSVLHCSTENFYINFHKIRKSRFMSDNEII